MSRKKYLMLFTLLIITISVGGSALVVRRMSTTMMVHPPIVWFEDPFYPGVLALLYNYKTRAEVYVNTTITGLRILNRTGHVYDLRDSNTVYTYFEEWGRGCSYYITPDGARIEVTGNPTGGLYGGCVLRYRYPLDVVNLTAAFTMKTDDTGARYGIRGVVLANATNGYYYMIGLKNNRTGWFFGVYKYNGTTITEPGGPSLPALLDTGVLGYVPGMWFNVIASYIVYPNGTIAIRAWLYNVTAGGTLVSSISVIDPVPIPRPNTFGVSVYQIINQPSAVFQMVAFTRHYNLVITRGLRYCCHVYVYDSGGMVVGNAHVNETGIAEVVLSTSIVLNGTIKVICGEHSWNIQARLLIGGDVYEIYFAFEGPILRVYTNTTNAFTGWLVLSNYTCIGSIYIFQVGLANQTYTTRENITLLSYNETPVVTSPETERIVFAPLVTGWVGNVTARSELYYNATCTLTMRFHYNFTVAAIGTHVINLTIRSV